MCTTYVNEENIRSSLKGEHIVTWGFGALGALHVASSNQVDNLHENVHVKSVNI